MDVYDCVSNTILNPVHLGKQFLTMDFSFTSIFFRLAVGPNPIGGSRSLPSTLKTCIVVTRHC